MRLDLLGNSTVRSNYYITPMSALREDRSFECSAAQPDQRIHSVLHRTAFCCCRCRLCQADIIALGSYSYFVAKFGCSNVRFFLERNGRTRSQRMPAIVCRLTPKILAISETGRSSWSRIFRTSSRCSTVRDDGRPPTLPRFRAAASPSLLRSTIRSRSN